MFGRTVVTAVGASLLLSTAAAAPAAIAPLPSRSAPRPVEPGFVVTAYAETQGTPTSLAFGPSTRKGDDGRRLYVADFAGNRILALDEIGGVAGDPVTFATGLRRPLGVIAAKNGDVFVSDSEAPREGPWGFRPYGRVLRLTDTDRDGVADRKTVVIKDLPNGRHNTNGMAWGPDGLLYITNGNSTDDGIEGGESEVIPWSGSVIRVNPRAEKVSLADLDPRRALVAHGWRNVYDAAFSPVSETKLFVPMNGIDDARKGSTAENPVDPNLADSDDLLYMTDTDDGRRDHFGFPSCLYNIAKKGNLRPYGTPNPDVRKRFGACNKVSVPRPVASFGLHTSADGLAFQTTNRWRRAYRNDLFVAEWGSLFGPPRGHDVIRVEFDRSGTRVVSQEVFLVGGLPIDITFDRAGAMYVADFSGTIFKIDRVL